MGIRTIASEENCPPVRVRVWVKVRVSFRVEGEFSSGAIVLEPFVCLTVNCYDKKCWIVGLQEKSC